MSHYAVLVAIPGAKIKKDFTGIEGLLDEILAPYDEGTEDPSYLEFEDRTDKVMEWAAAHKDRTIEEIADDEGYTEHDGKYGYFVNPNAKWDWYSIGGRWSGMLHVAGGHWDVSRVGDIDWESMRETENQSAKAQYELYAKAMEEGKPQPDMGLAFVKEDKIVSWGGDTLFVKGDTFDDYLKRRGYTTKYPISTYAYVDKDGSWHERGEMGWFGLSSNDKELDVWLDMLHTFIDSLDADDVVACVDCHI